NETEVPNNTTMQVLFRYLEYGGDPNLNIRLPQHGKLTSYFEIPLLDYLLTKGDVQSIAKTYKPKGGTISPLSNKLLINLHLFREAEEKRQIYIKNNRFGRIKHLETEMIKLADDLQMLISDCGEMTEFAFNPETTKSLLWKYREDISKLVETILSHGGIRNTLHSALKSKKYRKQKNLFFFDTKTALTRMEMMAAI
ncbi:unnamed protein product, partial [marine sediment metagenome]